MKVIKDLGITCPKEKRLLSVAGKAGVRINQAITDGNRERACHYMKRMYRLLEVVASMRVEMADI